MSTDIVGGFGWPQCRLRYSPASPFARKVRVAAIELGLSNRIELVPSDVWAPDSDIARDNPLGKVPVLVTPDGTFIGSTLCCQYLDSLGAEPRLVPATAARWRVLQLHALADGIMEAAVAQVTEELRRPAQFVYAGFVERQWDKIRRAGTRWPAASISPPSRSAALWATWTFVCRSVTGAAAAAPSHVGTKPLQHGRP